MTVEAETVRRLQGLAARLRHIAAMKPSTEQSAVPIERAHAVLALLEVTAFLDSFKQFQDGDLTAPLKSLGFALGDLETGVVAPMLALNAMPGARPMSSEMQILMAASAIALDMLIRFRSETLNAAAKQVAGTLEEAGFTLRQRSKRQPLARVVAGWRDRLNIGPGGGAPGFALEQWQAYQRALHGDHKAVDVDACLARLSQVAGAIVD